MEYSRQPVLTSHENNRPRGKQRYEVYNPRRSDHRVAAARNNTKRQASPKPPKSQGFCHDQMLAAYKGVKLKLVFANGESAELKLIDLDRYTLLVERLDGHRALVFKSDLAAIVFPNVP